MKRLIQGVVLCCLFVLSCQSLPEEIQTLSAVPMGERYGFIDNDGNTVIAPQFAYAKSFSQGLAAVNIGGTFSDSHMPSDGKWGFLGFDSASQSLKILINPTFDSPPHLRAPVYDIDSISLSMHEAYSFSEGKAAAYRNGTWMYIDRKGNPIPDDLEILSARKFSNGLAAVYLEGGWGYVRYNNVTKRIELAIEARYLLPADFQDGFAYVMEKNKQREVINSEQELVLLPAPYKFHSNVYNDYGAVKAVIRAGEETETVQPLDRYKIGFHNIKTGYTILPQFDQVGHFSSELCPVLVGSRAGKALEYPDEVDFTDFVGGKWGFIDESGTFAINPVYDDARSFHEGLAAVKVDNHWGYIDPNENWVFPPRFKQAGNFSEGIARVKMGSGNITYYNREALINASGEVIWIEGE